MTTIEIDNTTVTVRTDNETSVHRCATARVAQVTAATIALNAAGWHTSGPSSDDHMRRPLLLAGERMGTPLDGARSDERAQGFTARKGDAYVVVDACAGMPLVVVDQLGDVDEAIAIAGRYLTEGR